MFVILLVAIGVNTYIGINNINEIKQSRRKSAEISCRESNEHHEKAKFGLEALVAKRSTKHFSKDEAAKNKIIINEITNVIAPSYDCSKRVRELTAP
jgi:hypothetical protein